MFLVVALDHSPALLVLATEDEDTAFRVACKYAATQNSRVVVAKSVHGEPITPAIATAQHSAYLEADAIKAAALKVAAAEDERALRELVAGVNVDSQPASDDAGGTKSTHKKR